MLAAIAAAGNSGHPEDKKNHRSRYVMYINKVFGNRLKKNYGPVYVYARICEIEPNGHEIEHPEMTSRIQAFSQDNSLYVEDAGMISEGYCAAKVIVPQFATVPAKGKVSFYYEGENGSFTENVIFDMVGESEIVFPEKNKEDPIMTALGILGDTSIIEVLFRTDSFVEEPISIELTSDCPEIEVSYEPVESCLYKVLIKNLTTAPEINIEDETVRNVPLARIVSAMIHIKAYNEKETAAGSFELKLYPFGISVEVLKGEIKNEKLMIDTEDDHGVFKPVELAFIRAVRDRKGKVIADREVDVARELMLTSSDEASMNVFYGFRYEIEPFLYQKQKAWRLTPKVSVPDDGRDIYTFIWTATTAHGPVGYQSDLPVCLTGEKTDPEMEAREKEIALLKRSIDRYGLHGAAVSIQISDNLIKLPASVIHQMRFCVLKCANQYFIDEAKRQQNKAWWMGACMYTCMGIDWLGQQAFSYAMKIWVGDIGEMIITPIKNAMVEAAGSNIHKMIWDIPFTEEDNFFTWQRMFKIFDDMAEGFLVDVLFGNITTEDLTKTGSEVWNYLKNFKTAKFSDMMTNICGADYKKKATKAAAFAAVFALLNFHKHLILDDETKGDIGKSVIATINDCTVTTLKQIFSKYIMKWMGDKFGQNGVDDQGQPCKTFKALEGWLNRWFGLNMKTPDQFVRIVNISGQSRQISYRFNGADHTVFGRTYGLKTSGDKADTLVGQFGDGLVGTTVEFVWKWTWDTSAGKFVSECGGWVCSYTLGGLAEFLFNWLYSWLGLDSVLLKEEDKKEIPKFIPISDERIEPKK